MSTARVDSGALHERVRRFGRAALGAGDSPDSFEALALDIARHQARQHRAIARLAAQSGAPLTALEDIPVLPADAFRLGRVAGHPESADVARFITSGTSGGAGVHAFRSLDTYRELCVSWGRRALLRGGAGTKSCTVLALAAPFEPERKSSLGYMLQEFMRDFDGRPLVGSGALDVREPGRWLLASGAVDLPALRHGIELGERRAEPLLLCATSFALVWLLEALGEERLRFPPESVIMLTGGFKGHARTLDDASLVRGLCQSLGVEALNVIGEYGMTELSSQLYDGGLPQAVGAERVYVEPPWLRVTPVDPVTLSPVALGEVGLGLFTDLCNVDSALNVLTQDRVRRVPGGIVLVGRQAGARLRGCSLAVEALLPNGATSGASAAAEPLVAAHQKGPWHARPEASGARGRLERLLTAASQAVAPGSAERRALSARLGETTGLSLPGIDWGLDHCLELTPSPEELTALIRAVPAARRAHVILPGNVFVAAHRALALALAASEQVFVKASRREPAWVEAVLAQAPGLFQRVSRLEVEPGDHVWAYGSDTTLDALRHELPRGAVLHAHGSGFGVAVVDLSAGEQVLEATALAIAEDTACFDQRGCLSPRFVLGLGAAEGAAPFAGRLARALSELEQRVPRGRMEPDELADATWYRQCSACFGTLLEAGQGAVYLRATDEPRAVPGQPALVGQVPLELPPVGRYLEVIAVPRLGPALAALGSWLTVVGCADAGLERQVSELLSSARVVAVGSMQRPAFDGPVDLRTDLRGQLIG